MVIVTFINSSTMTMLRIMVMTSLIMMVFLRCNECTKTDDSDVSAISVMRKRTIYLNYCSNQQYFCCTKSNIDTSMHYHLITEKCY